MVNGWLRRDVKMILWLVMVNGVSMELRNDVNMMLCIVNGVIAMLRAGHVEIAMLLSPSFNNSCGA